MWFWCLIVTVVVPSILGLVALRYVGSYSRKHPHD